MPLQTLHTLYHNFGILGFWFKKLQSSLFSSLKVLLAVEDLLLPHQEQNFGSIRIKQGKYS